MTDDRIHLTTEQIMLIRRGAQRLRHQFEGTFNMETIERYMLDSRELLHSKAKFAPWLPQLGAGWSRQLAGDRVDVFSGGTDEIAGSVDVIVSMGQR